MASTREQIIEATCELLELQGYHATGLNEIVSKSKSPKGSLYYHFPGGKEEIAVEAITYVGNVVLNRIREHLAQVDAPDEAIRNFIRNIAYNVEMSGFRAGGPITTIALETASSNERLRDECQRIYDSWKSSFFDKLVAGGMKPERAQRIAAIIIAAIEGGVILCRTAQSRMPLEDVADEIGFLIGHAQS
jgi:TetR/AcrR family transcriptional regulator, lmrAB and yxaGH operons repressor